jgi:hypothetical protein
MLADDRFKSVIVIAVVLALAFLVYRSCAGATSTSTRTPAKRLRRRSGDKGDGATLASE